MIALLIFLCTASACSKDSSGNYFLPPISAEDNADDTIEYSGLTNPVSINQNNAQKILEEAFLGGTSSSSIASPYSTVAATQASGQRLFLFQHLSDTAQGISKDIAYIEQEGTPSITSAVIPYSIKEEGPCGGNYTETFSIDNETGDISGTIQYNDYCEMGVISNGQINIQGNIDLYTANINLYMDFTNYSVSYDDISQTMNGTVSLISYTDSSSMNMNIYVRDDASGRTCWMHDYAFDVTDHYSYNELRISGRFYDPDYGYVILSTPESFIENYYDDYPSQGTLVATGAEGSSGGNTRARLVVLSVESLRIDVDADGDGTYEWDSGTLYWEE